MLVMVVVWEAMGQNCKRAFTGIEILSVSPMVIGKEAYYYYWGFFPMGFVVGNFEGMKSGDGNGYPVTHVWVAGGWYCDSGYWYSRAHNGWQCSAKHECDVATVGANNFDWS
ncbi:unnamed protein product [Fraxinus pennsylvanica]|uniref:Uncharacterized protein n=1 Tax=Fraxinus pennsylvanica TaxID=56036 RepID=A0AAD2AE89_9LAMI|nr:unnamed protein product [Fraxinus pennsylvanica]